MGELLCPLPGAGLSGGCSPREAPGGSHGGGSSSGTLESAPAVAPGLSVCRAWGLPGGAADLLSSGQERPCCPGPSQPLPVPGGRSDPGLCPWCPVLLVCAVGFLSRAAQPPPRSCLEPPGAAPEARGARSSPFLLGGRCVAHWPGAQFLCQRPREPGGSTAPPGVLLQLPVSAFPTWGRFIKFPLLRSWAFLSWGLLPGS